MINKQTNKQTNVQTTDELIIVSVLEPTIESLRFGTSAILGQDQRQTDRQREGTPQPKELIGRVLLHEQC